MRTLPLVAIVVAFASFGCSHITNNLEHDVRGGLWFARETSFLGLTLDSSVWHCPPPRPGAVETCRQVHEGYLESRETVDATPENAPDAAAR